MTIAGDLAALRREDPSWDYRGEFTAGHTHLLHAYPAMMIPQVARRLIREFGPPRGRLLDPFCGSGGVLVEALLAGHAAWGSDLNPLGILISRVKTASLDPRGLEAALDALLARAATLRARGDLLQPADFNPAFGNVAFWFQPAVIRDLAALRAAILEVAEGDGSAAAPETAGAGNRGPDESPAPARDFFAVALSATVREVSNSRRQEFKLYRYPAEKLAAYHPDALASFEARARRNIAALATFRQTLPDGAAARVLLADAGAMAATFPAGAVDLIVTSPPYGDSRTTVAYGQYSWLSAQWLYPDLLPAAPVQDRALLGGIPAADLDGALPSPLLGAAIAAVAAQDPRRAREVLAFYRDFYRCLVPIARAVCPGGLLCFVVGNRRVKGVQLPTDLIIAELGLALGLTPRQIIVRRIPSKRMPLRNSPSNIPGAVQDTMQHEYIVILQQRLDIASPRC